MSVPVTSGKILSHFVGRFVGRLAYPQGRRLEMAGRKLSARAVAALSKAGRHSVGDGLYLQISKAGSRTWLFRYMLRGKAREMGLGPVTDVSLAEAREKVGEARRVLADGRDPIEARKEAARAADLEAARRITFKGAAEAYIDMRRAGWRNPKHVQQWENTLATYAYPVFGHLPVSEVDTALVLRALEPIWRTKTETATRVRGRIEAVLDWAKVMGYREGANPALWRGHLAHLLAPPNKVAKVEHHAALPWQEVAGFMAALRRRQATSSLALEVLILTAARTSEVLEMTWSEINLQTGIWALPAERMKAERPHRVPLVRQVKSVLVHMGENYGYDGYVFPGPRSRDGNRRPLSNMSLLQLLKRMGHPDITVHGFRSSFRDWASEATSFPNEVAEAALAHIVGDKVEAAYRRGDLFAKRRRMMEAWAEYCDQTDTSENHAIVDMEARAIGL